MNIADILHGPIPHIALVEACIIHSDRCPKRELTPTEKLCGVVRPPGRCRCGALERAEKLINRLFVGVTASGLTPLLMEEFGLRKREVDEVMKLIQQMKRRRNQKRRLRRKRHIVIEPNVLAALT